MSSAGGWRRARRRAACFWGASWPRCWQLCCRWTGRRYRLQSITLQPVFAGHGVMVLVAAGFLVGATILPAVLGRVLAVLLRLYVLLNLAP